MTAQKGKDLLIKIAQSKTSSTYTALAGLRASRISFNSQAIDATSISSGGWREILEGGGVRSLSVSGSGVFRDEGTDEAARRIFFAQEHAKLEIVIPDFIAVRGQFKITSLEYAGQFEGEATFEMTLESAGAVTFSTV